MLLELGHQRGGDGNRAPAGVGLRWAEQQRARHLDERFGDRDRVAFEVDAGSGDCRELAEAQACERRGQTSARKR